MDDLEEFLRRAAEKRQARKEGGKGPAQPPPQRAQQPPRPQPAPEPRRLVQPQAQPQAPPQRQAPPKRQAPPQKPSPSIRQVSSSSAEAIPVLSEAEIVDDRRGFGAGVAGHVAQHLDTREYEQRASQLGESVDRADRQLDQHLHDVFDHQVGSLSTDRASAIQDDVQDAYTKKTETLPLGNIVLQMIGDRQAFRSSFLLAEILKRPDWW